jgi:hypothetical protein
MTGLLKKIYLTAVLGVEAVIVTIVMRGLGQETNARQSFAELPGACRLIFPYSARYGLAERRTQKTAAGCLGGNCKEAVTSTGVCDSGWATAEIFTMHSFTFAEFGSFTRHPKSGRATAR